MASQILRDARIEINSVVESAYGNQVSLDLAKEEQDDTAFGDQARPMLAGLETPQFSAGINQDFASGGIDGRLFALWSAGTPVTVKVRPSSAAIGASNPEYVGTFTPTQYSPFGNSVGDAAKASIRWPYGSGTGMARNVA
ncbi:MAG TPA: hypothetical protein VFM37_04665 [Pseudonocardiaceae bacterium]|nr:hypothetical protein [Pseudonocardiaceae bacterium]